LKAEHAVFRPSLQPGVVFHEQDGFLVRHEFDPERTTRLAELHAPLGHPLRISPDGRFLLAMDGRDTMILDARDGRVVIASSEQC
jgi:hypothetical protein